MNSEDQFEGMVREHYEPLFRFAMRLTRSQYEAKDLTQQTFYVWATKGHQLRDISKARTWLFTTLHNAFLQERRKQTKFIHEDLEATTGQLPAANSQSNDLGDFPAVLSALTRVDEVYRRAVSLFYLNECSYPEIGTFLNVPVGTVKSRIARGIAQLREILLPGISALSSQCSDQDQPLPVQDNNAVKLEDLLTLFRNGRGHCGVGMFPSDYSEMDLSSTLLPGTRWRDGNLKCVTAALNGESKN